MITFLQVMRIVNEKLRLQGNRWRVGDMMDLGMRHMGQLTIRHGVPHVDVYGVDEDGQVITQMGYVSMPLTDVADSRDSFASVDWVANMWDMEDDRKMCPECKEERYVIGYVTVTKGGLSVSIGQCAVCLEKMGSVIRSYVGSEDEHKELLERRVRDEN